jgi:1,4-alpha-glucan branching enzyme
VPEAGRYRVLLNSDSEHYGGSNSGRIGAEAEHVPCHDLPHSLVLDLPPLAGLILVRES